LFWNRGGLQCPKGEHKTKKHKVQFQKSETLTRTAETDYEGNSSQTAEGKWPLTNGAKGGYGKMAKERGRMKKGQEGGRSSFSNRRTFTRRTTAQNKKEGGAEFMTNSGGQKKDVPSARPDKRVRER